MLAELRSTDLTVVAEASLHVTLRFLGHIDDGRKDELLSLIAPAVMEEQAIEAHLTGLGAFPSVDEPRVIFASLDDGGLSQRVESRLSLALEEAGIAREARPFHAHLTLARVKTRSAHAESLLRAHANTPLDEVAMDDVALFSSKPGRDGSVYTRIGGVALG